MAAASSVAAAVAAGLPIPAVTSVTGSTGDASAVDVLAQQQLLLQQQQAAAAAAMQQQAILRSANTTYNVLEIIIQ